MNGWIELLIGIGIGVAAASVPWFILARSCYQAGQRDGASESAQTQTDLKIAQSDTTQLRERLTQSEHALEAKRVEVSQLGASQAELKERLEQERRQSEEKLKLVEQARVNLSDAFKALSSEALKSNNEEFLKLARTSLESFQKGAKDDLGNRQKAIEQLTQPIRERLEKFDTKLNDLEKSRVGAYRELSEQVRSLVNDHIPHLRDQTSQLVKALRQPATRGRWGEVQLKRVVEMAGMSEHCDFEEQVSTTTEDGRLRPDMVVHLPGERHIVVDAKAPVEAYLEAIESDNDATRKQHLVAHARQVRDHITKLSSKSYFDQFNPAPEFVVLFVPGEAFFSAALMQDPGLIEYGTEKHVIMASPTTLIALLKAVSYGWRQEALARNAQDIAKLGKELYDRIGNLASHWSAVGQRLNQAVDAYDRSVGTLESRVLVSARRFQDLQIGNAEDEVDVKRIGRTARTITAPEKDNEE
ncbi:MAG: DNA recombination protein RmuC [Gammaproteobacteria bacterium]